MLGLATVITRIKNRRSDGVLKHSMVNVFFMSFITLINILYRKYVSSSLSIEDFGVFTAIFALVAIVSAPFAVFPLYISKVMSGFLAKQDRPGAFSFFQKFSFSIFVLSIIASIIIMLFSSGIRQDYRLHSVFPVLLALLICHLQLIISFFTAALQSFQLFVRLSVYSLLSVIVKLGMAILFFEVVFSGTQIRRYISEYNFAIFPGIIGLVVVLFIAYQFYVKRMRTPDLHIPAIKINARHVLGELFPMALLLFLFGVMRNIDEYFARSFLDDYQNGLYGSVVSVGKSSIFLVTSLVYVMFPKLSASMHDRETSRRIMLKGMVLAGGGFLAVFGVVLFFPEILIRILTHSKYIESAKYLGDFFIAYLPYSLVFLFINFFLIHKSMACIVGTAGMTALQFVLLHVYRGSISRIIQIMGIVGYATLFFLFVYWWYYHGKPVSSTEARDPGLNP